MNWQKKNCRLKHFPISFFSVILGLAGFSIAWQKSEAILKFPLALSSFLLCFTVAAFILISLIYLAKIIKFGQEVKKEFNHPVKLSFFPTFSISLLLLAIAFLKSAPTLAKYFWLSGAIIHFILTIKIVSIWIQHSKFDIKHMNPAWFIPAVGNILVPIAGIAYAPPEILWFFFSIGLIFWIILLVIFFNRIIFHHPLPEKLLPTLFILIAPPAVGFISYVKLTNAIDNFANILYFFALFLTVLLFAQPKMFYKIKFNLSWWAYSFPLSAITIASILMFHQTNSLLIKNVAYLLFLALNLLIAVLVVKSAQAIARKEICVEEE